MKQIFIDEFVIIDFDNNLYKFFVMEFILQNTSTYIVKQRVGKLGSNGKFSFKEFNTYKDAYDYFKTKKMALLKEGYISKEKAIKRLNPKPENVVNNSKHNYACSKCKKNITEKNYKSIQIWAEKEGNWIESDIKDLNNGPICIDCQKALGVFKRKF